MRGYIGGIIHRCEGELVVSNNVRDHIHLLLVLPRIMSVADLVKEIKTGSTKWIREKDPTQSDFHWQTGYGAFSISPSHKRAVVEYILLQQTHHHTVTFQEEYRRILKKYKIAFDERYVWD